MSEMDKETVESVSRFLSKLLRHEPGEYDLQLDRRGWCNVKDIRSVVKEEFDIHNAMQAINQVLLDDDENRFDIIREGSGEAAYTNSSYLAMMRANRGHTVDDVDIVNVYPETETVYSVKIGSRYDFVVAEDEEAVKKLYKSRLGVNKPDPSIREASFSEIKNVKDLLSSKKHNRVVYQSGVEPLWLERRVNSMGRDKGIYTKKQPDRVERSLKPKHYPGDYEKEGLAVDH